MTTRTAGRIAEAFELDLKGVLEDAETVSGWHAGEQPLMEYLQNRHAWDASMAPAYVPWLRAIGDAPPS